MVMRYSNFFLVASIAVVLCCCKGKGGDDSTPADEAFDTIPMMIQNIQECSKLYTAEYKVHKIITHNDVAKLGGKFMGKDLSVTLPTGNRKVAIPMDATLKAYIDFSVFSEDNIRRKGDKIEIILPLPHVALTSTTINHEGIRQYVSLLRSNFSDEELTKYEEQGRKVIVEQIPQLGILDVARRSAAKHIIPIVARLGYKEENITITFIEKDKEEGGITWLID